jgi:3-oxoacyl-[acyl-carrier protein] reductase
MKLLEGKIAIVTGGARGIGRSIALAYATEGAHIAITDLKLSEQTAELELQINQMGVKCKCYASDAGNFDETQKVVNQIISDFGTIDILVNNAGITMDTLLLRMTEQQWDTVLTVNLKSVFNFTKAVQMTLIKKQSGSIINMSSVVGVGGNAGQANYAASKAGMIGFTKSIAQELGSRNIRCNAIAPGFIITEMTHKLSEEIKKQWEEKIPLKRGGTPEEVAKVAIFLGSDLSSYVNGQVIGVRGGLRT